MNIEDKSYFDLVNGRSFDLAHHDLILMALFCLSQFWVLFSLNKYIICIIERVKKQVYLSSQKMAHCSLRSDPAIFLYTIENKNSFMPD